MASQNKHTSKPTLLLVDDEEDVTDILEAYLEDDFAVTCFNDSQKAYNHLKENIFDLMITDIRMPQMDGIALLTNSKKIHPKMHVILCTGHVITPEEKNNGIGMGASGVMTKPFGSPDNVLSFIHEHAPEVLSKKHGNNGNNGNNRNNEANPPLKKVAAPILHKEETNMQPKVLIIDDDEDVAEVLSALIESDFDTTITTDETKVLEKMATTHYDLIITDLNMPNICGTELIKQILEVHSEAKIIVSTGHDKSDSTVKQALDLGAKDILTKPFCDPMSLLDILNKLLDK